MQKLIIAKIEEGTVIDHIPPGKAIHVATLLHLADHPFPFFMATRLSSKKMGVKDLLKIGSRHLSLEEETLIGIIAPEATLSSIDGGTVTKKVKAALSKELKGLCPCPNPACITSKEPVHSLFTTSIKRKEAVIICSFCKEKAPLSHITQTRVKSW